MPRPTCSLVVPAVVALALATGAPAVAAIDFTGRWVLSPAPSGLPPLIVEFTQTGTMLSAGLLGSGTVDPATDSFSVTNTVGGCTIGASASGLPGGRVFYGSAGQICFGSFFSGPIVGTRCGCFDGNTADGDGCSATCQVEACFTCTGDPSVCTPTPDGGGCDDHLDCTGGETCAAGVCGGGATVPACGDMGGLWQASRTVAPPHADASTSGRYRVTQDQGVLFVDTPEGTYVGSVDPATGVFTTRRTLFNFFCGADTFAGTVAPDGQTFTAAGVARFERPSAPDHCDSFATTFFGTRALCGDGAIGAIEACDDGNSLGGDGCSTVCTVEPCWTCTGIPSGCTPDDGLACDDHNPCTCPDTCGGGSCIGTVVSDGARCDDEPGCTAGVCQSGGCQVTGPLVCDACLQCVAGLGCRPLPGSCHTTLDPGGARMRVHRDVEASHDSVRWTLKGGDATTFADLGDPTGSTAYALCLYDRSGSDPALLFRATIAAGGICGRKACWRVMPGRAFRYANKATNADGVASLVLVADTAGNTTVQFVARGPHLSARPAGLPPLPLPLPLTVQVQGRPGTCFGASYDAGGVVQNDPSKGTFQGRAAF